MADITKNDTQRDPTSSSHDPSKPWNQLRPRSLRSSGSELDEGCELTNAEAGAGFDAAVKRIDGGKR
jgi:hypothetical protein